MKRQEIENNKERFGYIFLPPEFYRKGFIDGDNPPSCDSEDYLTEVLNLSRSFMQKTKGIPFTHIAVQSHGEADAKAGEYELDFKMIGGQSAILAYKNSSERITYMPDGGIAYSTPLVNRTEYVVIHLALRENNVDELQKIANGQMGGGMLQKDISNILRLGRKQKNLFMFLPYGFLVNSETPKDDIQFALQDCFQSFFEYREATAPGFESYISCLYEGMFLIFEVKQNKLMLIDEVKAIDSTQFKKLAEISKFRMNRPNLIRVLYGKWIDE